MSNRHKGIFTNSSSWEEYWKYEIAVTYSLIKELDFQKLKYNVTFVFKSPI